MPKDHKKRGRRGEKRKHVDVDEVPEPPDPTAKRVKSEDDFATDHDATLDDAYPPPGFERPFFGMLDEEEQEYFKRADDMLEANNFGDQEERDLFLANVYKEAEAKELKIAQSQSCSRLMERLIRLSSPQQLKDLFQKFSGSFIHLVTHRFASHCCEALFLRAAPVVTQELVNPQQIATDDVNAVYVSMEHLFLHTLTEFSGQVGYLLTDKYASHVLRVLLLILSGEPFDESSDKQMLQSKRKEGITVQGSDESNLKMLERGRSVPEAFSKALQDVISESVAGLDTDQVRALATHPNGSPTLQLLLKLELSHFGKQRAKDETSIIRTLLPDEPISASSGSASFINGIIYDATGSRLVEQIVKYAPAKMFRSMYREYFKERLASFARNEIASYVVCSVLDRLGRDDLFEVHELLMPVIPSLIERNRIVVVRKLIERCLVREIDLQPLAVALDRVFTGSEGFDINRLLKWEQSEDMNGASPQDSAQSAGGSQPQPDRNPNGARAHFNLLAQNMLDAPGSLSALVLDALVQIDPKTLLAMAKDMNVGRTIQAALKTQNASIIQRRKLIQHFYGNIGEMALDKSASHVVDCIWEGTHGLAFIRERIAEELAENEAALRNSPCGRAIWRNWKMDIYKRRRADWVRQSRDKAGNDGFQSFSEAEMNKKENAGKKTAIELAREKHAKAKLSREKYRADRTKSRSSKSSSSATPGPPKHSAPQAAASG